jgi:hypothetical protein
MLYQIKKVLHCHFPDLSARLSSLNDPRTGIQYTIEELVMASLTLFLLRCESRNDFNLKASDEQFRKNYYRVFRLEVPQMDAVNELFEKMDTRELEDLRCRFIKALIEKRVFHKFRFFDRYFNVAADGTGTYYWGETPPEGIQSHALKRESKNGKITYTSQVLEAVLVCRNGMTIPLVTEWIANDGEKYDKQDCEQKAFKRLAVRLNEYFPRLPICILADGLYSNALMMDVCQRYDWKYITVFKDGNLPSVWQEVESLLPIVKKDCTRQQALADSTYRIIRTYRWVKEMPYQKHTIHWVECIQKKIHKDTGEEKENRFVFLTNLDVKHNNIDKILMAGRARWWIEEHFNTQKNRGGYLQHKFNRTFFDAIKNWHSVRQLACIMLQLIMHTQELICLKEIKGLKMTWKELWKNLNAFLTMCVVEEVIAEFEHWSKVRRQVRLE